MPATTRSGAKQSHLDDFTAPTGSKPNAKKEIKTKSEAAAAQAKAGPPKTQKRALTKPSSAQIVPPKKKRKPSERDESAPDATDESSAVKQAKLTSSPPASPSTDLKPGAHDDGPPVMINRAPVLELWGASVARFLYPDLDWKTCFSAGGAISTLCAISKGRNIGTIEEPSAEDKGKKAEERDERKRKQEEEEGIKEIHVMGFGLTVKKGDVLVSGKPRKGNEVGLQKKFGDEQYDRCKHVMEEALQGWKEDKGELDNKAFHMYEKFRPNVPPGQTGWGRKGQLDLGKVRSAIGRK